MPITRDRYIYFIRAGAEGRPIKIGIADDPLKRRDAMQIGCPDLLVLLAAIPGTSKDEIALHERFSDGWLHGEWFRGDTDGLQHYVDELVREQLDDEIERAQLGAELWERRKP